MLFQLMDTFDELLSIKGANIVKGVTLCVDNTKNFHLLFLINHKGIIINWISFFKKKLDSIAYKVSMFKTTMDNLIFQTFFFILKCIPFHFKIGKDFNIDESKNKRT